MSEADTGEGGVGGRAARRRSRTGAQGASSRGEAVAVPGQEAEVTGIADSILGPGTGPPPGFYCHLLPGDTLKSLEVPDMGSNPLKTV